MSLICDIGRERVKENGYQEAETHFLCPSDQTMQTKIGF
jgi:hypothetical protein